MRTINNAEIIKRREQQSFTNPFVQNYQPIQLAEVPGNNDPAVSKEKVSEVRIKQSSFILESEEKSSDSEVDSEIKSIRHVTMALNSGVKAKLRHYKKSSFDFCQQHKLLKDKVRGYQSELKDVKSDISCLVKESTETRELIKQVRDNFKSISEDVVTCGTFHESNVGEAVKKLQEDIDGLRCKLERTDELFRASRNSESNEIKPCVFERPKKNNCTCIIT